MAPRRTSRQAAASTWRRSRSPAAHSSSAQASEEASDHSLNPMTYQYTPSERGVLTIEPYKSALLPSWRFRTPAIAEESSAELWTAFLDYDTKDDFVGMDMARKFIQMGMTRSKRYANYKGGRKYAKQDDSEGTNDGGSRSGSRGKQLEKSQEHEGKKEKEEASAIFREVWERCKAHEGYQRRKEEWMTETKRLKAEAKKKQKMDSKAS